MKEYYFENIYTGELLDGEDAIKDFYSTPRKPLESWLSEWKETRIEIPAEKVKPLVNPAGLFLKSINI